MLSRIRQFFGNVAKRFVSPSWVYRPLASPFGLFPVQSGANVNEDTAISWTAIWRGLQLVGSAIGSMPFTIQEVDNNGDVKTRRDHPLWAMINLEPHPYYSTFDFLSGVVFQAMLRGNAVIVINRIGRAGGSNRPGSLRLVEWDDVSNIQERDGVIYYDIKGYRTSIPHYDVIHIKGLTKDGISGLDTLKWNRESFGLALSSEKSVAAYYGNGTHSDGFLSTDQLMKPEQHELVTKAWRDKNRNGETPLLTGGVKWNPMSVAPKDLQLLESRQFNVYEAARLLGISPHLLFAMDRANFSNVETLSLEFSKYTLAFWVERIEQEFNRKVFRETEKGRVRVNLNMDAFLRGDTEARALYLQNLLDRGVLSIDEARKIEGFNTLLDGKGKTHMVPLNFQTLEDLRDGVNRDMPAPERAARANPMPQTNGSSRKLNGHIIEN